MSESKYVKNLVATIVISVILSVSVSYMIIPSGTGEIGTQGPIGETGPTGTKGEEGDTGPKGLQGLIGPEGPAGIQGPKGDTGDTWPIGPPGEVTQADMEYLEAKLVEQHNNDRDEFEEIILGLMSRIVELEAEAESTELTITEMCERILDNLIGVGTLKLDVESLQRRIAGMDAELDERIIALEMLSTPDFDSEWIRTVEGINYICTLDNQNVFVYMIGKSPQQAIHQLDYGGDYSYSEKYGHQHSGVYWLIRSNNELIVERNSDGGSWWEVRVIVWYLD